MNEPPVYAWEYPDADTALAAFTRAEQARTQLRELSAFRCDIGGKWVVVCVDATGSALETIDWRPGVTYELSPAEAQRFRDLRLRRMVENAAAGKPTYDEKWHYGLGAILRDGGRLDVRVGRG